MGFTLMDGSCKIKTAILIIYNVPLIIAHSPAVFASYIAHKFFLKQYYAFSAVKNTLKRTREVLVNLFPTARDQQAFRVGSENYSISRKQIRVIKRGKIFD